MPVETYAPLRQLRSQVDALRASLVDDYRPFFDTAHKLFFRLPSIRPSSSDKVSVTTTATALMALATSSQLSAILAGTTPLTLIDEVKEQLNTLLRFTWSS